MVVIYLTTYLVIYYVLEWLR